MFRADTFITKEFGGVPAYREFLVKNNVKPPPMDTMYKWKHRNSIPGSWLAITLCFAALRDRKQIDLKKYVESSPICPKPRKKPSSTGNTASIFD